MLSYYKRGWSYFCALAVSLVIVPLCLADDQVVPVALQQAEAEGGAAAPIKIEPVSANYKGARYPGIKLTFEHRADAWNSVRIPVEVSGQHHNTLQFKAVLELPEGADKNLSVSIADARGNWNATNLLGRSVRQDDGSYQFSWDVLNQPDVVLGANLSALARVHIGYNFGSIPLGKTAQVTLIDMNFVAGQSVRAGEPELFKQWQRYIADYRPDYSDSARHLQPPSTGRLKPPLPLAREGKALAQIVVEAGEDGPLALAGKELAYWLGKITGATFPVGRQAVAQPAMKLFLGRSFAQGKFDDDLKWLEGSDGFAVRVREGNLFIFGASSKGTLNGVFAFLENNTDIIWPRPQVELSAVYSVQPSLQVQWGDAREKPATRLRGWATNLGLRPEHEIWSVRNRNNYPKGGGGVAHDALLRVEQGGYIEFGGGHNISGFLDNRKEFFPVIDGAVPERFDIWKHQPNFTAPGIADAVAQNALKYLAEKAPPGVDCININIEDNWGVSTDPKSLEPIKLPDGSLLESSDPAFRSTQYYLFLNEVARKIKQVRPRLMVGSYAYFFTATAPKIPLEDNIRVYFCPYVRKDQRSPLSAPINAHWWQQLEDWAKATPNVVIREYYGVMNGGRPLAEVVAFDLKSYLARGVKEYTAELNPDENMFWDTSALYGGNDEWDFMAMEFWVINRLYWNPEQDVEQLRKYYLRRTFHEAAPFMEKFFGTIRSAWYRGAIPSSFTDPDKLIRDFAVGTGHEEELRGLLKDGAAATKNSTSRMMVDVVASRFDKWASWANDRAKIEADAALTPQRALRYGWNSNTDWGKDLAWATATVYEEDGKTVPAVRITVRGDRLSEGQTSAQLVNPFIKGVKNGDILTFTLKPRDRASDAVQVNLQAQDTQGASIEAPLQAMTRQADGSIAVHWKLEPQPGQAFDVAQIKQITLTLSGEALGAQPETVLYLTQP